MVRQGWRPVLDPHVYEEVPLGHDVLQPPAHLALQVGVGPHHATALAQETLPITVRQPQIVAVLPDIFLGQPDIFTFSSGQKMDIHKNIKTQLTEPIQKYSIQLCFIRQLNCILYGIKQGLKK